MVSGQSLHKTIIIKTKLCAHEHCIQLYFISIPIPGRFFSFFSLRFYCSKLNAIHSVSVCICAFMSMHLCKRKSLKWNFFNCLFGFWSIQLCSFVSFIPAQKKGQNWNFRKKHPFFALRQKNSFELYKIRFSSCQMLRRKFKSNRIPLFCLANRKSHL